MDKLNISLNTHNNFDGIRLQIVDDMGRAVYDNYVKGEGNLIEINILPLKQGLYIYTVYNDNRLIVTGKFIKQD